MMNIDAFAVFFDVGARMIELRFRTLERDDSHDHTPIYCHWT